jgi:hypothetical protein
LTICRRARGVACNARELGAASNSPPEVANGRRCLQARSGEIEDEHDDENENEGLRKTELASKQEIARIRS